ncbi:MAG TPA: DUF1501 domain-containing protein [Caulobacteraceae bacterium]|nr:DUF1501 domain-containing protein [Caulobacteraceae bacterium]
MSPAPTRRGALAGAAALGFSIDFLGRRAFAASERELAKKRLVVVICRGGLDGLSLSPPFGDPAYAALRGAIAIPPPGADGGALDLDGTFGLHPALAATHALAVKGEARIAPAVATPDRERSHFEAQDVLESGGPVVYGTASGWLNRTLEAMGPAGKGISIGATAPLILRGRIEAATWSPGGAAARDARLPAILQDLYAHDPLLGPALASGLATSAEAGMATAAAGKDLAGAPALAPGPSVARRLGATLAAFMAADGGPQIAAASLDGFDTHANQGAASGQLANRIAYLDAFLEGLSANLGPAWADTVVLAATEFGRTARVNGASGTDHGTGSTALLLGGALKRGGIVGDWPTLAQNRLFENRDTWPALDMRSLFKGVLRDHLGLDRRALDTAVFPSSAAAAPLSGLV